MRLEAIILFGFILVMTSCSTKRVVGNNYGQKEKQVRQNLITDSRKCVGIRYKYGGYSKSGFDCSGLVYYVFGLSRIPLNRRAAEQFRHGEKVSMGNARAGDLIFFKKGSRINHVGIISEVDRNSLKMIHASSASGVIEEDVIKSTYWSKRIAGVKRIIQ